MNPTFKEYVFDFADLKLLSIVCLKCKAEIIIDVTGELRIFPKLCPSCGNEINPVFVDAVTSFYKIYKYLAGKDANASARMRIRREVNMAEF